MIIWLENLNYEMRSFLPREKPDYLQMLYVLSCYCYSVNKFIDNNLICGNQENIEAIKHFFDCCNMVADLTLIQINGIENIKFLELIKTVKRCKGVLKNNANKESVTS